eukprot:gene5487-7598_t
MLTDNQLLHLTEETGYRLCNYDVDSSSNSSIEKSIIQPQQEKIFSASWDVNDPNTLYICLQNGCLKVCSLLNETVSKYDVKFNRFTALKPDQIDGVAMQQDKDNNSKGKVVYMHWDKMCTIPNRPYEILFLLGISQRIYYSALPGKGSIRSGDIQSKQPLISSTTRGDYPDFIYGTPILAISNHKSRITSLSVSPLGHMVSSGDDMGTVKLCMLQVLDEESNIQQFKQNQRKYSKSNSIAEDLKNYDIVINNCHAGPIFSMLWLPVINCKDNNIWYYGLMTGSIDKSVKLWRISCCTKNGITVNPWMIFDTLSTHVLCLNSYTIVEQDQTKQLSLTKLSNNNNNYINNNGRASNQINFDSIDKKNNYKSSKFIYISAGTNIGSVYVWKLSWNDILNELNIASNRVDWLHIFDNGDYLHSLIQVSNKPIIHTSIALVFGHGLQTNGSSSTPLLLAVSDTGGYVRIHSNNPNYVHHKNNNNHNDNNNHNNNNQCFVVIGEKYYDSPVVYCGFKHEINFDKSLNEQFFSSAIISSPRSPQSMKLKARESTFLIESQSNDESMSRNNTHHNSELFVIAFHGEMVRYNSSSFVEEKSRMKHPVDNYSNLHLNYINNNSNNRLHVNMMGNENDIIQNKEKIFKKSKNNSNFLFSNPNSPAIDNGNNDDKILDFLELPRPSLQYSPAKKALLKVKSDTLHSMDQLHENSSDNPRVMIIKQIKNEQTSDDADQQYHTQPINPSITEDINNDKKTSNNNNKNISHSKNNIIHKKNIIKPTVIKKSSSTSQANSIGNQFDGIKTTKILNLDKSDELSVYYSNDFARPSINYTK